MNCTLVLCLSLLITSANTKTSATLEVQAPVGASVFLDGKRQDPKRTFTFSNLTPGKKYSHHLRVKRADGHIVEKTIKVAAGTNIKLDKDVFFTPKQLKFIVYARKLRNYATYFLSTDQENEKGIPNIEKVLTTFRSAKGDTDEETTLAKQLLANAYVRAGKPKEGRRLLLSALEDLKPLSHDHLAIRLQTKLYKSLAQSYIDEDKMDEIKKYYELAASVQKKTGKQTPAAVSFVYWEMARDLTNAGDFKSAQKAVNDNLTFVNSLSQDPIYPKVEAHHYLGEILLFHGLHKQPHLAFKKAMQINLALCEKAKATQSAQEFQQFLPQNRFPYGAYLASSVRVKAPIDEVAPLMFHWQRLHGPKIHRYKLLTSLVPEEQHVRKQYLTAYHDLCVHERSTPTKVRAKAWKNTQENMIKKVNHAQAPLKKILAGKKPDPKLEFSAKMLQKSLPAGSALVIISSDFYAPFPFENAEVPFPDDIVHALVITPDHLAFESLGGQDAMSAMKHQWVTDKEIQREVDAELNTPKSDEEEEPFIESAQHASLKGKVWNPLRPHLKKSSIVFIAAEDFLEKVPLSSRRTSDKPFRIYISDKTIINLPIR